MATKLKELKVNRVDLVDVGANIDRESGEGAHIKLWKRDDGPPAADDQTEYDILKHAVSTAISEMEEEDEEIVDDDEEPSPLLDSEPDADDEGSPLLTKGADAPVAPEATVNNDTAVAQPSDIQKRLEELEKRASEAEARASKAEADAAAAQSVAKVERDARILKDIGDEIKKFANLTITAEDAPFFKRAQETLTAEDYAKFMGLLTSANEQVAKSGLFTEVGRNVPRPSVGTAAQRLEAEAKILVEKGGAANLAEAYEKIATTRPELYAEHVEQVRFGRLQ